MILNLNDPASILTWWQLFPERHDPYLDMWARTQPEVARSVREAQRRIAADPALSALLVRSARAQRNSGAVPQEWPEGAEWQDWSERQDEDVYASQP